jgi:transcription elongation factor GreA
MTDTVNYISAEKKKELEAELQDLKGTKRKAIIEALEFAKSLGDLSENAEYHQAREEQGRLEERIAKIEALLKDAEVVTKHSTTVVSIGSKVFVEKKGEKGTREFMLVGSEEADMAAGKISNNSPLGIALIGKKENDSVEITTPKGKVVYKIIDIK